MPKTMTDARHVGSALENWIRAQVMKNESKQEDVLQVLCDAESSEWKEFEKLLATYDLVGQKRDKLHYVSSGIPQESRQWHMRLYPFRSEHEGEMKSLNDKTRHPHHQRSFSSHLD